MGASCFAEIMIGGPVPEGLLPELTDALEDAGLIFGGRDLRKHLKGGLLVFTDAEASGGSFERLEKLLQERGVEFDRWTEGDGDWEPELVQFRKGTGLRSWPTNASHERIVRRCDAEELLGVPDPEELRRRLGDLVGPELPELRRIEPDSVALQEGDARPTVRTFRVDVNLRGLIEAGVVRPGRKWPESCPPGRSDPWVVVFVQEDPEDDAGCLAEVRSYVLAGDDSSRDLGVELEMTRAVYDDDRIPWMRAWYEGPEPGRLRRCAPAG